MKKPEFCSGCWNSRRAVTAERKYAFRL